MTNISLIVSFYEIYKKYVVFLLLNAFSAENVVSELKIYIFVIKFLLYLNMALFVRRITYLCMLKDILNIFRMLKKSVLKCRVRSTDHLNKK